MNHRSLPLLVLLLLASAFLGSCTSAPAAEEEPPPVILISLDGFRWDYPEQYDTPVLDRIAERGVRAEGLIPVFPTKTFPNHYTQVTGLYPSNHGIVSNTMYDPEMDASFSLSTREAHQNPAWWGGEPLWATVEMQGKTAATFFWPGSEAPVDDVRPTYWKEYDGSVPGEARVDTVLGWLDLPNDERPDFITLYFSTVDSEGHEHGPNTPEVEAAIREVDGYLERLLDGLGARGIEDEVHLLIVSDHGMTATSRERVIFLDDYLDPDALHIVDMSPVLMAHPDEMSLDAAYDALKDAHPHLSVYRRSELPAAYHYQDHRRIPPLIAIADEGWSITTRSAFEEHPERFDGGGHGYDHRLPAMHGIFYAQGPRFQSGATLPRVRSIHLYELMAHLLDVEPAPNDGTLDSLRSALQPAEATP